jgi:hypothetical protein
MASSEPNGILIDQNRIYRDNIYALNKVREWRIDTGYMFQGVWNSSDTEPGRERVNHTIRVTLTGDVPLSKKK